MNDTTEFPESARAVGGLIGEIAKYTMTQAPRPNYPLAFAGALAFVSHLAARRYRTRSNSRPNLMLLALAWSGTGKDAPRKTNKELARAIGIQNTIIDSFRSGEALEDTVLTTPRTLSQYDEIDALLDCIKSSRDALGVNLMSMMLTLWGESAGYHVRRRLANSGKAKVHDQTPDCVMHPHFTLFGTGVTAQVYKAISDKMATNGFFARLLVIDAGQRGEGQDTVYMPPPADLVEKCRVLCGQPQEDQKSPEDDPAWDETGYIVPSTAGADAAKLEALKDADLHYNRDEDGAENAIWNRTVEKCEKLALVFALSEHPESPVITEDHWRLARELVYYSNKCQLKTLEKYSAETDYQDIQKRVLRRIAKGRICDRALLKNSHMKHDDLIEVLDTLRASGQIIYCNEHGEEVATESGRITSAERSGLYYALP